MNGKPISHGQASSGPFPLTRWSVIASAKAGRDEGLADLCEAYSPAVRAFLEASGFSIPDAKDLSQSFFLAILGRDFLKEVSSEGGRFRTFLIRSLRHHLCDQYDKARALKRGGGQVPASIHEEDGAGRPRFQPVDSQPTPETAYTMEWVRTLIANAFAQVERECAQAGKRALLAELEPVLHQDDDAPGYREIARRLGSTEGAVKVAAKRIRDRLRWLIRDQVKRTLEDETQCDTEIRELVALFGGGPSPLPPAFGKRRSPGNEGGLPD